MLVEIRQHEICRGSFAIMQAAYSNHDASFSSGLTNVNGSQLAAASWRLAKFLSTYVRVEGGKRQLVLNNPKLPDHIRQARPELAW